MELKVQGISKIYQKKIRALEELNITFENGVYGLLGPNGAGKSTFMQILTGNLQPTTGNVFYNGVDILKNPKAYKGILGYVPQNQGLYEEFSAERFLWYLASLKGLKKKEAQKQIPEVLDTVGLWDVRNRKLGSYSGGMKQRILIAQALLGKPQVIIMDEPTTGLDPKERIRIRNFVSQLSSDCIILIATHVVSDVSSIAKEIIMLGGGRILKNDSPEKLCRSLTGKVIEGVVKEANMEFLMEHWIISNLQEMPNGKMKVRLVLGEQQTISCMEEQYRVEPDLQDVYLSMFEHK